MVELENQSAFIGSQSTLQAPPETPQPAPSSKLRRNLLIVVGVGAVIILVMLAILVRPQPSPPAPIVVASPSPTLVPEITEMEKQLLINDQRVQEANPNVVIVPPPEVDMEIQF